MKAIIIFFVLSTTLLACEKDENKVCECENPLTELEWLKDLVLIAESDTTGNYQGNIYVENYEDNDAFFVEMSMGSGGIAGYWFDCLGNQIITNGEDLIPKRNNLIYSNIK